MVGGLGVGAVAVIASGDLAALGILLGAWVLLAALCVPCDYTLMDAELVVRSGFIKWRVPYDQITRVQPTRNPLSAPAWSLDRIEIGYGSKAILISPADAERFLLSLASRMQLRRDSGG
jgi:hypothetical protein